MAQKRRPTLEDIYRDSMVTRSNMISMTPKVRRSILLEQERILRFMSQKDIPRWFRPTSFFQLQAADDLLYALRDDGQQATTYRVRDCLNRLGITPKVKRKMVSTIMDIARGNDLAFLWFLREMFYKTYGEFYSINEQLIFSAIAHLDLITTLRELDRILPRPQPIKMHKKPPDPVNPVEGLQKSYKCRWRDWKKKGGAPYLEPIPPPRVYRPKPARRPNLVPQFAPYDVYIHPGHIVRNERNRWFTEYKLQPAKRVVRHLIDEELKTIFDNYEASFLKYNEMTSLCVAHKEEAQLKKDRRIANQIVARDNCLKVLDTERYHRQNRVDRIQAQLNQQVERYRDRLRRAARRSNKLCLMKKISNESRCAYIIRENYDIDCIPLETDEYDEEACCDKETRSSGNIEDASSQLRDCNKRKVVDDVFRLLNDEGLDCENCKQCKCFVIPPEVEQCNYKPEKPKKALNSVARDSIVSKSSKDSKGETSDCAKNYNFGHSEAVTPPSSQKFFHAPSLNKPYQFDHSKIFYFKQKTALSQKHDIRSAVAKAVDSEVSNMPWNDFEPVNMDAVVKKKAVKIWKEQLQKRIEQVEMEAEQERQRMLKLDEEERLNEEQRRYLSPKLQKRLLKNKTWHRKSPLDYDADYYDPDDEALMVQMLKDAFIYMQKDPKFVLASIPDAHKLPILRAWIIHRFGKRYDLEELSKSLNESLKILKALEKMNRPIPIPHISKLGQNLKMNYSCYEYVKRKANGLKAEYYNEVYDSLMDNARIIWFAIQPYLCSTGPPRNTFFAYMPSRIGNIMPFRPWKKHEFTNAYRAREERMTKANKQRS